MKKLMNLIAMALCAVCAWAVEYDYYENEDGTVTLSGVRGSVPADLVIPSEIDGRAVTGIGTKFCEECDSLRSVKLPDSIKTVADHSFDECGKLKSVELNEGLLEIGRKAFCECPIETLELPSTLESVGEGAFTRSNIPGPLFSKSTSGLKSILIRHGDNSRFEACGGNGLYDKQEKRLVVVSPYATSFRVPDGCEFIGHTALLGCGNLTSITFPESLTEVDDEAFAACVKLTHLDFSKTRLGRISEQAFCGCIELVSVSFPDTLVEIGGGAFCGANKLQTVRFLGNAPYVNVDYEETSGKWGNLYIAIRDFKSSDDWVYDGYIKTVSTYVKEGATGWGEIPGVWQGCPVRHEPRMDLDHAYYLHEGNWNGWKIVELDDENECGDSSRNCWLFHFSTPGADRGNGKHRICIPVRECAGQKIKPVLVPGLATLPEGLSASVLTDAELVEKFGFDKYKYEIDDYEYEYENSSLKIYFEVAASVWPDFKTVEDRQWIVVSVGDSYSTTFFSPKTFSVGIFGTDQMTPTITVRPDSDLPSSSGFSPKTLWGFDVTMLASGEGEVCFDPLFNLEDGRHEQADYIGMRVPYIFDTDEDDDEYGSVSLSVPAKGSVYIKFGREWWPGDGLDDPLGLSFTGSVLNGLVKKFDDGEDWDVWGVISTSAAGKVKISGYGEKLYVNGVWFRPDTVSEDGCVATEAWYREWMNCANDHVQSRYRCYVTGMGVTKFGDKTTLVCHPNKGEVFDHWEFVNCTAPKDATINDVALSFTASQTLYDEVGACTAGLRTVIVRPVLKPRRTVMVQTNPCGAATVSGNGAYFKGEKATVMLEPVEGCTFRGWSDGDKSGLTRVFDIGDQDIVVSALFDGVPVYAPTAQTIIPGDRVDIYAGFIGYSASGLPSGLRYDKTTGRITGAAKKTTAAEGVVVTFKKSGVPDETLTIVVRAEEISVGCEGLSSGPLPAGVAGAANGIALQLATETDVKSVSVSKLPAGMKYDAKKGVITGVPTKAGSYEVSVTVTSKAGNKKTEKILVSIAAMPGTAVGTFNGFVTGDAGSVGTFALTTTDAGKLTAKAITAAGTVSFSGTCWDSVEDGVYRATLTTKKGETLSLTLDSNAAWDANQLSGTFTTALIPAKGKSAEIPSRTYSVSAQRNAFGKTWYFTAAGDEQMGWTFAYTKDAKAAALTVTLKADGSTAIAGKLGSIKISASGYANVGGLRDGAIMADFAPIVTVNKVKQALSIHTNLWFDRADDHDGGAGSAALAE